MVSCSGKSELVIPEIAFLAFCFLERMEKVHFCRSGLSSSIHFYFQSAQVSFSRVHERSGLGIVLPVSFANVTFYLVEEFSPC